MTLGIPVPTREPGRSEEHGVKFDLQYLLSGAHRSAPRRARAVLCVKGVPEVGKTALCDPPVPAPGDRAVLVPEDIPLVITEGNHLLRDGHGWERIVSLLGECLHPEAADPAAENPALRSMCLPRGYQWTHQPEARG